ncbi:MAG TPA: OmpA family protein [Bacteroidales bacterium]|nr:OmpA family protein [Bacteroidales bacterium]
MKRNFSSILLLCISIVLFGQYDPRENFYDAEFFLAQEDYAEALYAFTQVYNEGYEDNANVNYRIGICLLNIKNRETEAIPYLEKAVTNITDRYREGNFKEEAAPRDAYLYLANAYRYDNQFDNAIKFYNTYLDFGKIENEILTLFSKQQIEACKRAKSAVNSKNTVEVGTLGQLNDVRVPIYNAVVSGDLSTLAFMGRQKFYNGIYVSRNINGKWTKPFNITPSVQSDGNQDVLSLSHDGNKILLAWYDSFESNIWVSEYKNDRWNVSKPLEGGVNSRFFESHASFSPDGEVIYFTSNRRESVGEMDIFRSRLLDDGTWSEIEILGENVNTPLNEDAPFVSNNGNRLYFSSQGHDGLGGYDLFYCDINEDGTFSEPVNLGYPLNSSENDFAFSPEIVEYDNYLTVYSKGPENQVDVFRFEWIPENASPVAVDFKTTTEEEVAEETLAEVDRAEKKDDINEDMQQSDIQEPQANQEPALPVQEEDAAQAQDGQDADESGKLPDADAIIRELKMLRPVYFSFDNWSLSETATRKLDDIAAILDKFPGIEIEIVGHTDALGDSDYNVILSKRRAKAVADYLKSKDIAESRLKVSGVGESDHIAINRTPDDRDAPEGRALNRRVHFNTSVPGGVFLEIEAVDIPDNLKMK